MARPTVEELRAMILRPEAVERLRKSLDFEFGGSVLARALTPWADELARTIAQAVALDASERDEAVRALLAELAHGPERMDDQRPRVWWGNLQAAIGRVRRAFSVTP